jgi:hypothetical protein
MGIMTPSFDIFLIETDSVRWLESAANFEEAAARAQEFASKRPGEYLLLNQKTGNKHFLKLDGIDADSDSGASPSGG